MLDNFLKDIEPLINGKNAFLVFSIMMFGYILYKERFPKLSRNESLKIVYLFLLGSFVTYNTEFSKEILNIIFNNLIVLSIIIFIFVLVKKGAVEYFFNNSFRKAADLSNDSYVRNNEIENKNYIVSDKANITYDQILDDEIISSINIYKRLAYDNESIDHWLKLAKLYKEMGNKNEAKKAYLKIIKLPYTEENTLVYLELGKIYREEKRYKMAEIFLLKSITFFACVQKDSIYLSEAYYNLASVKYELKKFQIALIFFKKSLELLPEDSENIVFYYYGMGLANFRLKNYKIAKENLEFVINYNNLSEPRRKKAIKVMQLINNKLLEIN